MFCTIWNTVADVLIMIIKIKIISKYSIHLPMSQCIRIVHQLNKSYCKTPYFCVSLMRMRAWGASNTISWQNFGILHSVNLYYYSYNVNSKNPSTFCV